MSERKDFFGLRYPNHEPIYLDRFGIEFQVTGMIVTGKGGTTLHILMPGYGLNSTKDLQTVFPSIDEWIQLLKQTDDPEYFETDPSGAVKAIHRKNMRQIAYDIQWQVYRRAGFRCEYCESSRPLTIDHWFPVELGGTDEIDNLKAACRPCNRRKGNMHPREWEEIMNKENKGGLAKLG